MIIIIIVSLRYEENLLYAKLNITILRSYDGGWEEGGVLGVGSGEEKTEEAEQMKR